MEFPSGVGTPVEHHYRIMSESPFHKLKAYIEMVRLIEKHRFCALSGPGMDKHHFLTWLFGYGDSLVGRILATEDRISGTRNSLLDLRTELVRRLG
jgi:hypothetical protein